MSLPFRIYSTDTRVYSLFFDEKMMWNKHTIEAYFNPVFPHLEEITSTFNSLNFLFSVPEKPEKVRAVLEGINFSQFLRSLPTHCWEIPICVDAKYTGDLVDCFDGDFQKVENYLKRFLETTFEMEFYGFLPGFGYLSGLPNGLILPRKRTASRLTQKGTVAIGGSQVGVYPQTSPGGWQGIGHCPVPWFNPQKKTSFFIKTGDAVRFVPVDEKENAAIAESVEKDFYLPKKVIL